MEARKRWWSRRFWCSEGVDGVVQGRWWRSSGGTAAVAWWPARLAAAAVWRVVGKLGLGFHV